VEIEDIRKGAGKEGRPEKFKEFENSPKEGNKKDHL
jgi:hypothetical protein